MLLNVVNIVRPSNWRVCRSVGEVAPEAWTRQRTEGRIKSAHTIKKIQKRKKGRCLWHYGGWRHKKNVGRKRK